MSASGQIWWPSAGGFLTAYGQDLMSADNAVGVDVAAANLMTKYSLAGQTIRFSQTTRLPWS